MGSSKNLVFEALKLELEKELAKVLQHYNSRKANQKNKTLFHYTNLHGLKAIIENQSFFASNSAYLNDKEEYNYGIDLFKKSVKELKISSRGFGRNILTLIDDELNNKLISCHYVTCFSLEGDLLSQWRAYADDGKGIAIGFDLRKLTEVFQPKATGMYIEYVETKQKELVEKIMNTVYNFYISRIKLLKSLKEPDLGVTIVQEINEIIDKYVGQFKHSSFKEEREFRFDLSNDNDINKTREISYRVSKNNLLVPYLELKTNYQDEIDFRTKGNLSTDITSIDKKLKFRVKKLPVKEIIIGPSIDFELNKKSILDFLIKNGYTDKVLIKKSNVPYRI